MATPKQRQKIVTDWLKAEGVYEEFVKNTLRFMSPGKTIDDFFRHYLGHIRAGMWPDYRGILVWSWPETEEGCKKWKEVIKKWRKYVEDKGLMRDGKYY